jgi:hypothetical protein
MFRLLDSNLELLDLIKFIFNFELFVCLFVICLCTCFFVLTRGIFSVPVSVNYC